jgi:hypothetical protein
MKKPYEKEFNIDIKKTIDIHQKIREYQREMEKWMFSSDDELDDRRLAEMGIEEGQDYHGGSY